MNNWDRATQPIAHESEEGAEILLRPQNFSEYIGQSKVVANVAVMVESAKLRNCAMDHALLSGPPGLGKTSLAMLIAKSLGTQLHLISGPAIEKKGDLAAILTNLNAKDVLFIDEIHRMHIAVEEILYSAMEDFRLDIMIGQGAAARTMQIDLPAFTLLGATTRTGLLSHPLRDRFIAHLHFDFYRPQELEEIIANNSRKLQVTLDSASQKILGRCARGTPRIANRILRRVRDYALVEKKALVTTQEVQSALILMDVDGQGLDRMDRKILSVIANNYSGGPVGIEALCATLGEDRHTIEDVFEPYLLQEGFLLRTPRGRMISEKSKKLLEGGDIRHS